MPSTYLGTEFFLLNESAPNLLSESEGRKEGRGELWRRFRERNGRQEKLLNHEQHVSYLAY